MNKTRRKIPDLEYFQYRYSCYLNVLDFNATKPFERLYSLENETFELGLGIFCFVFAAFIIIANCTFIFGLVKTTKTFGRVQKLFILASCSDLISGVIALPLCGASIVRGLHCEEQALMVSFFVISVLGDGFGMVTISILRLRSIMKPLSSSTQTKKWKMKVVVGICSIIIFSLAVTIFLFYVYGNNIFHFQLVGYAVTAVLITLNTGLMFCALYTLYQIRKKENQRELSFKDKKRLKIQRHSANTLLIIGIMMFIALLLQTPSLILLNRNLGQSTVLSGETFIWTKRNADFMAIIATFNTGFNSVVLMSRSKKIRRYLRGTIMNIAGSTRYSSSGIIESVEL